MHGSTISKTTISVSALNTITVEDQNDWASLHSLQAILQVLDPDISRQEVAEIWRSWDVSINSKEASAYIRDMLVYDYGVTCIHYIDQHEIPGTDCYIMLIDCPLKDTTIDEVCPNWNVAAKEASDDLQIEVRVINWPANYLTVRFRHGQRWQISMKAAFDYNVQEAYEWIIKSANRDVMLQDYFRESR